MVGRRPLGFLEALHHFKQYKCLLKKKKKKKSFSALANILSIVKHFSVKVSAVCREKMALRRVEV